MALLEHHAADVAAGVPVRVRRVRAAADDREGLLHAAGAVEALAGPVEELVADRAAEPLRDGDLVAVDATRGRRPGRGALARLVSVDVPALVVRDAPVHAGRIAVVDDGSAASLPALCAGLAAGAGAEAPVLLAGPLPDLRGRALREDAMQLFRRNGVACESVSPSGEDALAWSQLLRDRGASLVVVSTGTAANDARAWRLAATAPCTVLLVR